MTEMEQLKENTRQQLMKERLDDIGKYLEELGDKALDRLKWRFRAINLELFSIFYYWGVMVVMIHFEVNPFYFNIISNAAIVVVVVSVLRSWILHAQWCAAEGEWRGCVGTLQRLGMIPKDEEGNSRKKVKRRSLFARFKEFTERMGAKNKMEATA